MDLTHRIVVICDEPETRQRISEILGSSGLETVFIGQERDEVNAAIERGISLVIYDYSDNKTDERLQFVKWLRKSSYKPSPPILLLAGEEIGEQISDALKAGADGFICRPFSPVELLVRVRRLLRLHDSTDPVTPRERAFGALLGLTQTLVSSLDFQEILYTIVKKIAEVVQVDRVSIVLVPDEPDVGYVVATSDDAEMSHFRLDLNKYPEILHVISTKSPLVIEDVETHPVLDMVRASVRDAGLTALTLIPIVWEDQVMGTLFIRAATHKGVLTPRQMFVCQALVNATAIALRNAQIMQSLREESQVMNRDRLETERQLESLKRYADVFAASADGIAVFDENGRVLMVNPGAGKISGYRDEEVLNRPIWEVIHEEDRTMVPDLFRRMLKQDNPENFDLRIKRKDGNIRTINCSFSPFSSAGGTTLILFRDVTDARRTREELIKTKNFLESLIGTSVDAIVATDYKGTIIIYNRASERIYGWRAEEVLHKMNVKALYYGDGARDVGRMLRSEKFGGLGRVGPIRMEAINCKGERFPISLTAAYIYENEEHTATFGIFTDLRERVRVERELALAQEKLAISEKQALIAELAGATAHELNQPLTGVIGYAELLSRKLEGSPDVSRAVESIRREAERMAEIVRKIGKLTKYETQSYVGRQRILDLDRASGSVPDEQTEGDR